MEEWFPRRDDVQWVLGTIYLTQGSSYRKAGSHMLLNDIGEKFGLLSGGCLEADLHRKARQALTNNQALIVEYDTSDEDDMNFSLGLGCGGIIHILLQPINFTNNYLHLMEVNTKLKSKKAIEYRQQLPSRKWGEAKAKIKTSERPLGSINSYKSYIEESNNEKWLISTLTPNPSLLIVGGGIDARPLATIASNLGWETTITDPRPANARREDFLDVTRIKKAYLTKLSTEAWVKNINAAVIMSHNVEIDADALQALASHQLDYCALLGPLHRQEQVLSKGNLTKEELSFRLAGPAGLDIGAELPESIALAILAECHAAIFGGKARSLSGVLN